MKQKQKSMSIKKNQKNKTKNSVCSQHSLIQSNSIDIEVHQKKAFTTFIMKRIINAI